MTDAEAAWLKLLRDQGPQSIDLLFQKHSRAQDCLEKGWSAWSGDPDDGEEITPAGLAALAIKEATP